MPKSVWSNSEEYQVEKRFPDMEHKTENPPEGTYDVIWLNNLLQQAKREQVGEMLHFFFDHLNPGGEMYINVPSLEWATQQLASKDDPRLSAYIAIYGSKDEPNLCGLTIHWLRAVCEHTGLRTMAAYSERVKMHLDTGDEDSMQNIYVGAKDAQAT
jgi:hypothetical protein